MTTRDPKRDPKREPELPKYRRVTDPDIDAPDSAVVDGYERHGDWWVRVADTRTTTAEEGER